MNSKYFFNSWCCILDYLILNCKLWDKFLISMIILILIISYILIFYRHFEFIFEFVALRRAPISGRNVCLSFFFCVFLYLIVIILIEENKKKLTLCQNNEKWTKILWILGQYNSRRYQTCHFKIYWNFESHLSKLIYNCWRLNFTNAENIFFSFAYITPPVIRFC